jgi:hypothetical protein
MLALTATLPARTWVKIPGSRTLMLGGSAKILHGAVIDRLK